MNLVLGLSLESASKGPGLWKVNPRAVSGCHYLRILIGQKTLQFKAFHEFLLLQYVAIPRFLILKLRIALACSLPLIIHQYPWTLQWQCSLLDMKTIDDFMVSIFPGNLTVSSDWRPPELQDLWPQAWGEMMMAASPIEPCEYLHFWWENAAITWYLSGRKRWVFTAPNFLRWWTLAKKQACRDSRESRLLMYWMDE